MQLAADFGAWVSQVWQDWAIPLRLLFTIIGALVVRWLLLLAVRRVVRQIVNRADGLNRQDESETSPITEARIIQRTKTMGTVSSNLITWSVAVVAVLMLLTELGVASSALVAGAGLLGAGIGFGAQTLIRDLLAGLFIVFEDQYGVGDVVDLGTVSGVVEAVGLRVTTVRDVDGTVWYVRNGEAARVGNKSQGWSRIIIDIPLAANANVAKAEELALKTAKAVASKHRSRVIGAPEVWGIQSFSGSETTIRLIQQCRPNQSDAVARELKADLKGALSAGKIALAPKAVLVDLSSR
jgi:small conductance mechanosensitive channel